MRAVVLLAVAYALATRAYELWLTRRNGARLAARGARLVPRDGIGLLAGVHALWFLGLVVEELVTGPSFHAPAARWTCLALFLAAEALRFWCKASLGERFSVRVIVLPGEPLVSRGPYRFARHPNYAAALVLVAALPLALGLVWTPALVVPLKILALARRVRVEDAALAVG